MRIWGAPVLRELGQSPPDCSKCRRPEQKNSRVAWGCDAPSAYTVFEVGCTTCSGSPDCPDCGGSGVIPYDRCPSAVLQRGSRQTRGLEWLNGLLRAYIQYDSRNVLPMAGGYADQSAGFGRAVDIIDEERGRYEGMRQDKARRDQKLQQMRSQNTSAPRGRR